MKQTYDSEIKLSPNHRAILQGSRVAIVQAKWHHEHTDNIVKVCTELLVQTQCVEVSLYQVPGCYELPLAIKRLAALGSRGTPQSISPGATLAAHEVPSESAAAEKFDAIIPLGALIRGETDHYQVILETCIREIGRVMYEREIPIIMEILPVLKLDDLIARCQGAGNKGIEAARATVEAILWHRNPCPVWSRSSERP